MLLKNLNEQLEPHRQPKERSHSKQFDERSGNARYASAGDREWTWTAKRKTLSTGSAGSRVLYVEMLCASASRCSTSTRSISLFGDYGAGGCIAVGRRWSRCGSVCPSRCQFSKEKKLLSWAPHIDATHAQAVRRFAFDGNRARLEAAFRGSNVEALNRIYRNATVEERDASASSPP